MAARKQPSAAPRKSAATASCLSLLFTSDGFIRYSAVLKGNIADPKSFPSMVDNILAENHAECGDDEKVLIIIDAGIAK